MGVRQQQKDQQHHNSTGNSALNMAIMVASFTHKYATTRTSCSHVQKGSDQSAS